MTIPPNLFESKAAQKKKAPWLFLLSLFLLSSLFFVPLPHILKLRGIVISQKEEIQAPYDGKVTQVFKDEGDKVGKGEILARLSNTEIELDLEKAALQKAVTEHEIKKLEGLFDLAQKTVRQNLLLYKRRAISTKEKEEAEERLLESDESLQAKKKESASLDYEINKISEEIKKGVIQSNYEGTIGTSLRAILSKELKRGDTITEVLIPETSLVEVMVPDSVIKTLKIGDSFRIRIGSELYEGSVAFLGPRVYQTIQKVWVEKFVTPVRLKVQDKAFTYKPGTSVKVFIQTQNQNLLDKLIARYF